MYYVGYLEKKKIINVSVIGLSQKFLLQKIDQEVVSKKCIYCLDMTVAYCTYLIGEALDEFVDSFG